MLKKTIKGGKGRALPPRKRMEVTIRCLCGEELVLRVIGGQYQNAFDGECVCGRKWCLEEQES